MAYQKTPQEQLSIIRQSCLNRAISLYVADKLKAGKLEMTAEYFVDFIYHKLGLEAGAAFSEIQTQGAIVLQSSLTRAVELAVAGKIEPDEITGNTDLFADYVYKGIDNATC